MEATIARALGRAFFSYLILTILFALFGKHFGPVLAPLFQAELRVIAPDFPELTIDSIEHNGVARMRIQAAPDSPLVVGGKVLDRDLGIWPMTVTTPLAQTFQIPIVLLTGALSWPVRNFSQRIVLVGLGCIATATLVSLDIPLILYGTIWASLRDAFAHGTDTVLSSLPTLITDGGRLAACIVALVLIFCFAQQSRTEHKLGRSLQLPTNNSHS